MGRAFIFDGLGIRFDGVGLCFGWAGVFVVAQKTKARMREYRGQNEGGSRPEWTKMQAGIVGDQSKNERRERK